MPHTGFTPLTFMADKSSDAWKQMKFKPLNIGKDIRGLNPKGGHMHTLLKYRAMIREIFLEMGYGLAIKM